jgi:putative ABC transport system ATP-binding protein
MTLAASDQAWNAQAECSWRDGVGLTGEILRMAAKIRPLRRPDSAAGAPARRRFGRVRARIKAEIMRASPALMTAPLLDIRDLAKVYRMGEVEVQALRQVNLSLPEGEFIVLLGPSGSGKSTLLNIIGGLDVPTSGQVFYRDVELTRADEAALTMYRRKHVGFVFQFYNLIPSLTAAENVSLVTEIADEPMTPDAALRLVNLGPRATHFPAQLSGGEQQRVAIARAVAKRPAVLLCDEPTGALDISTGIVVLEALAQVNADLGTTTVVITHNVAIAEMADRVVRLADGQIISVEARTTKKPPRELSW